MDSAAPTPPLKIAIFRNIWIAWLAANLGLLIQAVGASWLMTTRGGSPTMVALVAASSSLPIMLLSLWAGAIADNLDRRKVMIFAQGFAAAAAMLLFLVSTTGHVTPLALLAFTFLIGCGTALNAPSWQASVGDLVPRSSIPQAVALNAMANNLARSVGPAIGGVIVAAANPQAAFLVNALANLGLIVVLYRWRPERPPPTLPPERLGMAMKAGVRYVSMSPHIRYVAVRAACFAAPVAAVPALMPLVARDLLGGGPLVYGLLFASFGVGAVGGALLLGRLRRLLSTERLIRVAALACAVGLVGAAFSRSPFLTAPLFTLAGVGWVMAFPTFNISVQMASPRWVVGRALAIFQMALFGGLAIGSWLFGAVTAEMGAPIALCLAAAGLQLSILLGLKWPLPPLNEADLDPQNRWKEPQTEVPIHPRAGPIVITIEHRIAEQDALTFLAVMSERRRIRRRDGALHWTLLRDLADRDLWIERYHVPTWLDYVRHNGRRTHADAVNDLAIRALWIDGTPPVVHRMIERQVGSLSTPDETKLGGAISAP